MAQSLAVMDWMDWMILNRLLQTVFLPE